jgi:hypothetical protein
MEVLTREEIDQLLTAINVGEESRINAFENIEVF